MEEEKKLPVPKHLEKIFQADLDETDTYELKGTLKCTCGCEQRRICPGDSGKVQKVRRQPAGI